jgi:uncharacterized protein (DUF2164 family)
VALERAPYPGTPDRLGPYATVLHAQGAMSALKSFEASIEKISEQINELEKEEVKHG